MSGAIPAIESRQKQVVLAQFHFSGFGVDRDLRGFSARIVLSAQSSADFLAHEIHSGPNVESQESLRRSKVKVRHGPQVNASGLLDVL